MHRNWNQPVKFQHNIDDAGFRFAQEMAKNERYRILEQLAMECRTKRGDPCGYNTLLDPKQIEIGRRNIVFRLRFIDGEMWVARIRNPLANRTVLLDSRAMEM
jgi:hypothetical protein